MAEPEGRDANDAEGRARENDRRAALQRHMDEVLQKIGRCGPGALTEEDRGFLGLPAWSTRRGIRTTDYNNCVVLIRASLDDVGRVVQPQADRWGRDVLGRTVLVAKKSLFLFRLRGHAWTEVVASDPFEVLTGGWARALSRRLKTRVIDYGVSDTSGAIGYSLYEAGSPLETYKANGSGKNAFRSAVRENPGIEREHGWAFPSQFFREQGAYELAIEYGYFFGYREPSVGEWVQVQNPGWECVYVGPRASATIADKPDFERVDYIALKQCPGKPRRR